MRVWEGFFISWSDVSEILLPFVGGLGMFLFGMHTMASGLQKTAGNKMRRWLEVITRNRFIGVLVGALVTAVIQSSSATTVMVVGFVNAGIMSVSQTIGLIMGANIGTTVTAWIVSSAEWAYYLNPTTIAPATVLLGACMVMFSQNDRYQRVGEIIVGFGILFFGMSTMSDAVKPLSQSEVFKRAFLELGSNPVLGILTGAFVTAIIQSSSASVGILQSLASAQLVPWSAAVYIIMGQNIGTCVTALLSSIGASKNAKSAAYIHLLFNTIGSIVFSVLAVIYFHFINAALCTRMIDMTQIGAVHTAFNIANTILLFGFGERIAYLAMKMAGVKADTAQVEHVRLDDRILGNPSFAIESCLREIERMAQIAYANLALSCEALLERDSAKIREINEQEEIIDQLQQATTRYLGKICNAAASPEQITLATTLFHTVNDIERVGDHAVNLSELAEDLITDDIRFSAIASDELVEMMEVTKRCFAHSVRALTGHDREAAQKALEEEEISDTVQHKLRSNHMMRLSNDECVSLSGVVFLDAISNLERVSDHAKNIAETVLNVKLKLMHPNTETKSE